MHYIPLPDEAARQVIDAQTTFAEFLRVRQRAADYAGGMYWKQEGGYQYLVKTGRRNQQTRLGPRSPELEAVYRQFHAAKAPIEARLAALRQALRQAERLNKAVKAGRTPRIVVDILNKLDEAGLARHFTVVGTHALYAYEMAAGVRITPGALATQDVDLLWDARKRVSFLADMAHLDKSMLALLREVDPSFERKALHNETAINNKGFEVDFLRRMQQADEAPLFEHVVIGATGTMAHMRTVAPSVFVRFKQWLAAQPDRAIQKRHRDEHQARIVQYLIDDGLLPAA